MLFHTNNSIYLSHNDGQQVSHTPSMHCYGCVKKCLFGDAEACARKTCTGLECYIWPDNNSYLVEGIRHYFECVSDKYVSQPVVIIDFSHKNITYFLNNSWLEQFKNMRLILVTDKKMTAIAHYWFYNDTSETIISTVIFHDDIIDDIKFKIRQSFLGKITRPSEKKAKLSANEYALFSELYKGQLPKKIAMKNATNVKNIYAMKIRIENKLGVPISRLAS